MEAKKFSYLLVCVFSMFAGLSNAGVITINQTATASIEGKDLLVDIEVSNTGDTSAFNMIPRIVFLGVTHTLSAVKSLPANKSFKQSVKLSFGDSNSGEFHVLSLVDYDDDKSSRHTNAAEMYLNTVPIASRPIDLMLTTESNNNLENKSTLIIENRSVGTINVELSFIAAENIAVNQESMSVSLKNSEKTELPVILNSLGFKESGSKSLFILARYKNGLLNYSQLLSIAPQDMEESGIFETFFTSKKWVIGLGVVFGLIILIILILNIKSRIAKVH